MWAKKGSHRDVGLKNHVRQDSKYARGGEMRNVVDRRTKFAVLCDEAF